MNETANPDRRREWVERDICFLYHELSSYSLMMGDLSYGDIYRLPYWEFLSIQGIPDEERRFIRDGCLVMIFAMAWDQVCGSGVYIDPHIPQCLSAIEALEPEDEEMGKLLRAVRLALHLASERKSETPEFEEMSLWVHKSYVRRYFKRTAEESETNPYFSDRG